MTSEQRYIIGISGGTCSGKTALAAAVQAALGQSSSTVLSMDSYYINPDPNATNCGEVNFDHPNAIDLQLFKEHLASLVNGDPINCPVYDRSTHKRVGIQVIISRQIIIIEGLFMLWDDDIRNGLNLKVFLDTDADIRLGRRMIRDAIEYGIDVRQIYQIYVDVLRPMHMEFIEPTKHYANLILKWPLSIREEVAILLNEIGHPQQ